MCVQGSAKRRSPCLVNFVAAVAYHFWLALPAAFTQPGNHIFSRVLYVVNHLGRSFKRALADET